MFDAQLRPYIDPTLNMLGRKLASWGITPNAVTCAGLFVGLGAAFAISQQYYITGLVLLLVSRVFDGLDGAVARATRKTDFGGLLDIVFDFFFYGAIPLGFVFADPPANAVAGAVLLFTFYANGASFLAYAIMAEKHDMETSARGSKSLYFTGGLAEAAETFAFFAAFCLFPTYFPILAYIFAGICIITTLSRLLLARQVFRD